MKQETTRYQLFSDCTAHMIENRGHNLRHHQARVHSLQNFWGTVKVGVNVIFEILITLDVGRSYEYIVTYNLGLCHVLDACTM